MSNSKTFRNIVMAFVISGLAAILGYVLRIYLARSYAVSEYGLVYSMIAFFSLVLIFIDIGLTQAVIKKTADFRAKNDPVAIKNLFTTVFLFQLIFTFILSIIFYIYADFFTTYFFHSVSEIYFRLIILWFLTMPLYYAILVYFLSHEKTTWWGITELLKIIFILLVTIFTSKFLGLKSVFIAYGLVNIIIFILFIPKMRTVFGFSFKASLLPDVFKYGFYISIGTFAWTILTQSDTLVITYFKGLNDVGLYQAALPIAAILGTIISPITLVLFSKLTNLWANNEKKNISELVSSMYKYILILFLPVTLALMVFSDLIINLIFGMKYIASGPILSILSLSFMVGGLSNINYYVLSSIGKAKDGVKVILIGAILNLVLAILFIQLWGTIGVAIAILIANLFMLPGLIMMINKNITLVLPFVNWIKTLFASIIFIMSIFILKSLLQYNSLLEAIICLVVSGIIYLCLIFMLKIITVQEIVVLVKSMKK